LIFVIGVLIVRRGWSHTRRMQLAGAVMSTIVVASLAWAVYETGTAPTLAYFNTFARVWELGVGALLAIAAGLLARIPAIVKHVALVARRWAHRREPDFDTRQFWRFPGTAGCCQWTAETARGRT
jgi:peptidoglycan/LPS O-acetylase OafA/YrhL